MLLLEATESEQLRQSYAANCDRLVEMKTAYDPTNLSCVNYNIAPRARCIRAR